MPRAALPLFLSGAIALAGCGGGDPDYVPEIEEHERRLGAEQHEQLLAQFGGRYEGPEAEYVRALGQKMAAAPGLADECTFTLVNTDVVNAFAVPGCYIYVTRGLLGIVNSEAELASILGHELGHIVADHSERQQQRSLLRQLGVLAVGWATESELLTRIAGGAAELFTLRYSRTHEHEADDLAIRYLIEAGYDPYAAADMLEALGRNESYRQQDGGSDVHAIPEWARTHPLTGNRVERVRERARDAGIAPDALPEEEAAFMGQVDDLLYGDDPRQGFVRERRFSHPEMRIAFEVPSGFALTNTPQAVLIHGPDGLQGEFGAGPLPRGGLEQYAAGLIDRMLGGRARIGRAEQTVVNGIPALLIPVFAQTDQGQVEIVVAAYAGEAGSAYHFILVSPPGQRAPGINALIGSFRRLSPAEAGELRPLFIEVVEVEEGQTVRDLAGRMASDRPLDHFIMLNGLPQDAKLEPGDQVKIIRPGG